MRKTLLNYRFTTLCYLEFVSLTTNLKPQSQFYKNQISGSTVFCCCTKDWCASSNNNILFYLYKDTNFKIKKKVHVVVYVVSKKVAFTPSYRLHILMSCSH